MDALFDRDFHPPVQQQFDDRRLNWCRKECYFFELPEEIGTKILVMIRCASDPHFDLRRLS